MSKVLWECVCVAAGGGGGGIVSHYTMRLTVDWAQSIK